MSITHITLVLNHYEGTAARKLVLLLIADHAQDHSGWAWPWARQLASRACIDDRQIRKHIKHLVETDHVLEVVREGGRVWNAESRKFTNEPTIWRIREDVLAQRPSLRLRGRKLTPCPGIDSTGDYDSPVLRDTPSPVLQDTPTGCPQPDLRVCGQDTPSPVLQDTPPCSDSPVLQDTLKDRQELNVKDLPSSTAPAVDNAVTELVGMWRA